jgi:hypothetical protein
LDFCQLESKVGQLFVAADISAKSKVTELMAESLDEWKIQLVRRFQANASKALSEADKMTHSFKDESVMDVREYITHCSKSARTFNLIIVLYNLEDSANCRFHVPGILVHSIFWARNLTTATS